MICFPFPSLHGTTFATAALSPSQYRCPHHCARSARARSAATAAAAPQPLCDHHYCRRNTCCRRQIITAPRNLPLKYCRRGSIVAATAPFLPPRLYRCCRTVVLAVALTTTQLSYKNCYRRCNPYRRRQIITTPRNLPLK